MRVKAAVGRACAPRSTAHGLAVDSGWTGHGRARRDRARTIDAALRRRACSTWTRPRGPALPHRPGAARRRAARALGRVTPDKQVRLVRGDRDVVRAARPQRRAADRARPAARPGRSASSRSAAGPAPASRRWRSARAWRRCWSAGSTARSWCSARCTRSAARSSATCPAARPRRWTRGRRRSSTPSARWSRRRSSRRSSTAACWRCCRSPTSAAGRCTTPS